MMKKLWLKNEIKINCELASDKYFAKARVTKYQKRTYLKLYSKRPPEFQKVGILGSRIPDITF